MRVGGNDVFDRRCDESKRDASDAKQCQEDRSVDVQATVDDGYSAKPPVFTDSLGDLYPVERWSTASAAFKVNDSHCERPDGPTKPTRKRSSSYTPRGLDSIVYCKTAALSRFCAELARRV